jgi:hypothetical protein
MKAGVQGYLLLRKTMREPRIITSPSGEELSARIA